MNLATCRRCQKAIVPDGVGYLRLHHSGLCEGCEARRVKRHTYAEETANHFWHGVGYDEKIDDDGMNLEIVMPYMDQIEDLLDPSQIKMLRSMIVDMNLDMTGTSYRSRHYGLKVLGFSDYDDYCRSDLYNAIRFVTFEEKGISCVCCPSRSSQIHHRRYSLVELMGLSFDLLEPICADCHREIEVHEIGKRKLKMANWFLDQKIAEHRSRMAKADLRLP